MNTKNKLKYKVIMYLLLCLCAVCISVHMYISGAPSVQERQDSHFISVNNDGMSSGDGNTNPSIHKKTSIIDNTNLNITPDLLHYAASLFSTIILSIQISEFYFNKQDLLYGTYKRSLIALKIRMDN